MTPEENIRLARLGLALHKNVIAVAVEATCWAVHLVLSLAAISVICGRSLKGRGPKVMLAILVLALIVTTLSAMHDIDSIVQSILNLFFRGWSTRTFEQRLAETNRILTEDKLSTAGIFLASNVGLMALVGDAVILWRAWVLWMRSKWWLAVPAFLYFVCVVLSMTSCALYINAPPPTKLFPPDQITTITAMMCSLAANLITTSLIGYQAYSHRKMMTKTLGNQASKTWRILFFITEAGLVYLVIQIITAALFFSNKVMFTTIDHVQHAWIVIAGYVSVTYPAIVILIVAFNRSLGEDTSRIGMDSEPIGTHISFGRRTATQTSTRLGSSIRNDEDVELGSRHEGEAEKRAEAGSR